MSIKTSRYAEHSETIVPRAGATAQSNEQSPDEEHAPGQRRGDSGLALSHIRPGSRSGQRTTTVREGRPQDTRGRRAGHHCVWHGCYGAVSVKVRDHIVRSGVPCCGRCARVRRHDADKQRGRRGNVAERVSSWHGISPGTRAKSGGDRTSPARRAVAAYSRHERTTREVMGLGAQDASCLPIRLLVRGKDGIDRRFARAIKHGGLPTMCAGSRRRWQSGRMQRHVRYCRSVPP